MVNMREDPPSQMSIQTFLKAILYLPNLKSKYLPLSSTQTYPPPLSAHTHALIYDYITHSIKVALI